MKKSLSLLIFLAITTFSFAQQTFTSKEQALSFLKELFSENFIKTPLYKTNGNAKQVIYDYEIRDSEIIIWTNNAENGAPLNKNKSNWYVIPYRDISVVNASPSTFRDTKSAELSVSFGSYSKNGFILRRRPDTLKWYGNLLIYFPLIIKKGDDKVLVSILNATTFIAMDNGKIPYTELPPYIVFSSANSSIALSDFIDKNRRFKNKPTLIITWGNWCPPCIKIIDELLNKGAALKYNIVLVNKDAGQTDLSALLNQISNHTPDYNKDAILLFDKNNQLEPIDKNTAPLCIWLDKNLKIVRSYLGLEINATTINNILVEIE